ncbi:unnamed protein product [Protopolystoma xenopodis]|uniref:Dynactin subunit 6 n=1 Tax=Protopolystoma xenopodis TaxID=117903 RepID=A0A448XLL2_9PLAT|nr:unnamed protein product [Protopolystoma xenopodis]
MQYSSSCQYAFPAKDLSDFTYTFFCYLTQMSSGSSRLFQPSASGLTAASSGATSTLNDSSPTSSPGLGVSRSQVKISAGAIVCSECEIRGDVTIGTRTVIHPKVSIIAEAGPIIIGESNLIEELVELRNTVPGAVMVIGDSNFFEVGLNPFFQVLIFPLFASLSRSIIKQYQKLIGRPAFACLMTTMFPAGSSVVNSFSVYLSHVLSMGNLNSITSTMALLCD